MDILERCFHIREKGSNLKRELLGGITAFFTAAYLIAAVSRLIASAAGMEESAVMTAVCVSAAVASLAVGFFSNLPFAAAPGLGFAVFFSYTLLGKYGYSYGQAAALVFLSGILFLALSLSPVRDRLLDAIPLPFKFAVSTGVGLMLTLSGLIHAGLVTAENNILDMGNIISPGPLLALLGVFLTAALILHKVPAAALIGIAVITVIGIPLGVTAVPQSLPVRWDVPFLLPDFAGVFRGGLFSAVSALLALTLSQCFDAAGILLGVAGDAKMTDNTGELEGSGRALSAAAVCTCIGAFTGTPNAVPLAESATGVREGARTGLSAVTAGLLFLILIPFAPLSGMIPGAATAAVLIVVGMGMMSGISQIHWKHVEVTLPCFLIIVGMPFTGSVTDGIALGCISYVLIMICRKRAHIIDPWMYVLAGLFILLYV